MANIGTSIATWSTTEASNQPDGPDSFTLPGDLRAIQAAVRYIYAQDTIASATTTDLGSKSSGGLTISGTTTITGLGTIAAGIVKRCLFSGALTLTHNATSLILPGAANITTVAGDVFFFESLGSGNWRCVLYLPTTGGAVTTSNTATLTNKTLTSPTINTPTINTVASVGGAWTAAAAWTLPALTLGGTVTLNGQSFSGTCANGGTVTTIDINGGTVDGATIGGSSRAAASVSALTSTGSVLVDGASGLVGYGTGAGGTVTQATSKATAVTINKPSGAITTHNASLAAGASVAFAVNNSLVAAPDTVSVAIQSGAAALASYIVRSTNPGAGIFYIVIKNDTAGALSEALVINFNVHKGVAA